MDELVLAIRSLKNNNAYEVDEIPAEVFKCYRPRGILLNLFNECFSKGMIPSAWKHCIMNPISKSPTADPRELLNYRDITLTCACCKLYCNILNNRLSKWEADNTILSDNQNDFRKGRSTVDYISSLTTITETRTLHKKSTFAVFYRF